MKQRRCSEHHEGCVPLKRPNQITCSSSCRQKRARRLKREAKQKAARLQAHNTLPEHLKPLSVAVNKQAPDILRDLLIEEMKPIVREAVTENVMQGIAGLVALTPRLVELIARDLESSDPNISQKAQTLVARYTLGNASVAPTPAAAAPQPMQVQFLMPRPGDEPAGIEAPADELRTCVECEQEKPVPEFVGASPRCQTCHDGLMGEVEDRFGA